MMALKKITEFNLFYIPAAFIAFIVGVLVFLFGLLLFLKRKIRAWWLSVITLIILVLILLRESILISSRYAVKENFDIFLLTFLFLIPLILFLLDRKNFFKIAS